MGFFYSGGGERTVINEAMELEKRGHEVTVYAPIIRPEHSFPDLIKKIEVKGYLPIVPITIPMREAVSMVASSAISPALAIKFKQYDVFICHGQPSSWIGYVFSKILKKPYISYLHQPNRFLYPRPVDIQMGWRVHPSLRVLWLLISKLGRKFIKALDTLSVAKADAVFTNSKWITRWVKQVYSIEPEVCYPGVNKTFFEEVKNDPFIEARKPFILSTCRHYPQKRLDWLIQILPRILEGFPSVKLVLTGSFTKYTTTLQKLSKELKLEKNVFFEGEVSEQKLKQLYTTARIYAYPSPVEDFGLGPLEAGACRTPSIVWDYAGPAETVIDGVTGFRSKPYNLDDFAEKAFRCLTNDELRNNLASNAQRYVKQNFTWKKHVDKIENNSLNLIK